jgi:hypothetical protein
LTGNNTHNAHGTGVHDNTHNTNTSGTGQGKIHDVKEKVANVFRKEGEKNPNV